MKNGAWKYTLGSYEWQTEIDKGLAKDSTIAYLWQQKAMPYFKARKYEVGMTFLDKAVQYNPERWQPYRGFMKCIFSKSYKEIPLSSALTINISVVNSKEVSLVIFFFYLVLMIVNTASLTQ